MLLKNSLRQRQLALSFAGTTCYWGWINSSMKSNAECITACNPLFLLHPIHGHRHMLRNTSSQTTSSGPNRRSYQNSRYRFARSAGKLFRLLLFNFHSLHPHFTCVFREEISRSWIKPWLFLLMTIHSIVFLFCFFHVATWYHFRTCPWSFEN